MILNCTCWIGIRVNKIFVCWKLFQSLLFSRIIHRRLRGRRMYLGARMKNDVSHREDEERCISPYTGRVQAVKRREWLWKVESSLHFSSFRWCSCLHVYASALNLNKFFNSFRFSLKDNNSYKNIISLRQCIHFVVNKTKYLETPLLASQKHYQQSTAATARLSANCRHIVIGCLAYFVFSYFCMYPHLILDKIFRNFITLLWVSDSTFYYVHINVCQPKFKVNKN